jgi:hypothetical protein
VCVWWTWWCCVVRGRVVGPGQAGGEGLAHTVSSWPRPFRLCDSHSHLSHGQTPLTRLHIEQHALDSVMPAQHCSTAGCQRPRLTLCVPSAATAHSVDTHASPSLNQISRDGQSLPAAVQCGPGARLVSGAALANTLAARWRRAGAWGGCNRHALARAAVAADGNRCWRSPRSRQLLRVSLQQAPTLVPASECMLLLLLLWLSASTRQQHTPAAAGRACVSLCVRVPTTVPARARLCAHPACVLRAPHTHTQGPGAAADLEDRAAGAGRAGRGLQSEL